MENIERTTMKYPPIKRVMPNSATKDGFNDGFQTGHRQALLDLLVYCKGNDDKSLTVIIEMLAGAE